MDNKAKQVAFAFMDYCKAKKISYPWSSANTWTLKAKGKSIGLIWIGGEKWIDGKRVLESSNDDTGWSIGVWYTELLQYTDFLVKEIPLFLNSLKRCGKCSSGCPPYTVKVLGNETRNICRSTILDRDTCIQFKNPDTEALQIIQKIFDFKLGIIHGTANLPILDPATDGLTRIENKLHITEVSDLQGNSNKNMNNLFDTQYNSYFYVRPCEEFSNLNIVFQLDKPEKLEMYSIVTGLRPDVPDSWTLHGAKSKDGPWTLLDTRAEFPKPVTLYTEKAFGIKVLKAYQYYLIKFTGWNFVASQVHLYTQ